MKSTAEELMDYCALKGVGKVGEQLYFSRIFDESKSRQEAIIFNDTDGGSFARRLDAIAFENPYVDVQVRADTPGRAYELCERVRETLERIKGYISPDKTEYHSALAQSPPKLLMYARGDAFVYSVIYRVMRKTKRA